MNYLPKQDPADIFNEPQVKADILQCLQVLSKPAPSNLEVQQCNVLIIDHMKKKETLPLLINILESMANDQNKATLIVKFISHYLSVQSRPGINVVRHPKTEIVQHINNIFFSRSITEKCKKIMQDAFSSFIGTNTIDFLKIRKSLCKKVISFYTGEHQLTSADLNDSLYIIEALLSQNLESDILVQLQDSLLIRFVQLAVRLIRELDEFLFTNQNIVIGPNELNKIFWTHKIFQITQLLFSKAKTDRVLVLKSKVIISSELAHITLIGLKLSHQRDRFVFEDQVYENQTQRQFYEKIDEIKLNILKIQRNAFDYVMKNRKHIDDPKYIPVIEVTKFFIVEIVPIVASLLEKYPKKALKNQQNIRETLYLLSRIIQIPALLSQFIQVRELIIWRICLPCFVATETEKSFLYDKFCDHKERIVSAQNVNNINQGATKILESYYDHIDGSLTYVAKSLISLMDFQLTADPQYFENIPQKLSESEFFKNLTYFEQFEAALTVMSTMSYHSLNRQDITIMLEQFIVRRQQFFSRVDVAPEMIVCFLQCVAYYLENFYEMVLKGQANSDFHKALIFHAVELISYSFDQTTKKFKDNDLGKIGTQAIDYISNVVIQEHLFAAIFPAHDPKSTSFLVSFMKKVCHFIDSDFNIKIIENVLIDFLVACTDRHYKEKNNYATMPEPLRSQISELLISEIIRNFTPSLKHEAIAKQKLMELFSLVIRICKDPNSLMLQSLAFFNHIIDVEHTFLDNLLTVAEVFLKRKQKEQLESIEVIDEFLVKLTKRAMSVCDVPTFQTEIFNLILTLNLMNISQEELTLSLLQMFNEKREQMGEDEDSQLAMQKILYLLMQISYSNFFSVPAPVWVQVIDTMVDYMRQKYVRQDTITIGKCTVICLSCYIQDPQGVQNMLGNRMEGLWDCILDDQLKYSTTAEKRLTCILLTRLLGEHNSEPFIKEKFIIILRTVCIIMYYLYEKIDMDYDIDDSDNSMSDENKSEHSQYDQKEWKEVQYTMKDNRFLTSLPDDRVMLRNLLATLKETDHENFVKFVNQLPIGIQNLIKNKIIMYREDTAVANKKKMRTIYKVRVPQECIPQKTQESIMSEADSKKL